MMLTSQCKRRKKKVLQKLVNLSLAKIRRRETNLERRNSSWNALCVCIHELWIFRTTTIIRKVKTWVG